MEEFVQYFHSGEPVDVTFAVKELKAFIMFCEGCEIDIHLYFEKAGKPILMALKFGLDDESNSSFDATLVLATMLVSQLHAVNNSSAPPESAAAMHDQANDRTRSQAQQERPRANASQHPSDHTKIWSELSGSAAKSSSRGEARQMSGEKIPEASQQREAERISAMQISKPDYAAGNVHNNHILQHPPEADRAKKTQDTTEINGNGFSQHHPSNWVEADEGDNDEDESEIYVQAAPPYYEEQYQG